MESKIEWTGEGDENTRDAWQCVWGVRIRVGLLHRMLPARHNLWVVEFDRGRRQAAQVLIESDHAQGFPTTIAEHVLRQNGACYDGDVPGTTVPAEHLNAAQEELLINLSDEDLLRAAGRKPLTPVTKPVWEACADIEGSWELVIKDARVTCGRNILATLKPEGHGQARLWWLQLHTAERARKVVAHGGVKAPLEAADAQMEKWRSEGIR